MTSTPTTPAAGRPDEPDEPIPATPKGTEGAGDANGAKPAEAAGAAGEPVAAQEPGADADRPAYHREDEEEQRPSWVAVARETGVLVVLAVALAVVFKTFLVQAFYIPSGSMEPTLDISDRVLVEKLSFRFGEPQDGDIIVFVHDDPSNPVTEPSNPVSRFFTSLGQAIGVAPPSERDFIKRVVGVPGDRLDCKSGHLFRNGRQVTELYLVPQTPTDNCRALTVPKGQLYVMGDNRTNSADSRVFGPIDKSVVVGRAFVRIWPLNRIGWLRRDH